MTNTVVLGCGIIGLYTTYLLLQDTPGKHITIIAKHTPGDFSHDYASPFAGATVNIPKAENDTVKYAYKFTYDNLETLRHTLGGEKSGISATFNHEYWKDKPTEESLAFFKSYNKDWKEVDASELPEGASFGLCYKSWVIESPMLIQNLYYYVVAKGVKVIVEELKHIKDAFTPDTSVVFNCTGLGSLKLGGVEDKNCHATRAQVVVVRAPHIKGTRLFWGDTATYMIKRPSDKHELILGGFYQKNNWNKDVLGYETEDILNRTTKHFPILRPGETIKDLDILRVVSAFRPGRTGGVRVEKEIIDGVLVVHNYGVEGTGYVQGLGLANRAIKLSTINSKL